MNISNINLLPALHVINQSTDSSINHIINVATSCLSKPYDEIKNKLDILRQNIQNSLHCTEFPVVIGIVTVAFRILMNLNATNMNIVIPNIFASIAIGYVTVNVIKDFFSEESREKIQSYILAILFFFLLLPLD